MHHPTAIIDPKAKLDKDVEVGPYCVIGPNVKVGSGTVLESHVILKGNTRIGKKNHIFQFSTVGDGSPDKKYRGEPTRLVIGDENQIREGVTIHRGTVQEKGVTKIGNRNLLLAYSHVAHDCEIEDDVVLTNQAALAGAVKARGNQRRATSDWMKVERERGISVSSSVMTFNYKDKIFNLLDTPGHQDFSEDTYRVLTEKI